MIFAMISTVIVLKMTLHPKNTSPTSQSSQGQNQTSESQLKTKTNPADQVPAELQTSPLLQ